MRPLAQNYLQQSLKNLLLLQMKKPLGQMNLLRLRSYLPLTQSLRLLVQNYLQQSQKNLPLLQMKKLLERNYLLR